MVQNSYSRVVTTLRSNSFGPCVRVLSRILPRPTSTPQRGGHRIVVKTFFVLGVLCMPFGIYHRRFRRFLSFRLPNRGGIVLSGLLGVCVPSVYHHRFRSPSFVQAT